MEHSEKIYNVIIDPAANDRMSEHLEFLAQVNENTASRLLNEMLKDIHSLETQPFRCPVFDRPYLPVGKYRYLISGKRYRIIFQIEGDFIFVDDIQDCRQNDNSCLM